MGVKSEIYNGVCVLSVQNDLAADDAAGLRKTVEQQIDVHHVVNYVVDLEQCSFVDSEGLEALLWLKDESEKLFGMMKLAKLDENVKKILEITRLSHRFDTHGELAEALKTMR